MYWVENMLMTLAGVLIASGSCFADGPYKPTWESLDSRPLPAWYDEAKIGIFIHWGVFSVPALSYNSEHFWETWKNSKPGHLYYEFMAKNYRKDWTYADFAQQFTAEMFSPDKWVNLFKDSGAKYTVLITKHVEGFCNWNTSYSFNWNSMELGPKRNIVAEFVSAARSVGLKIGLYHNMFEVYNQLFLMDKNNHFNTQVFVKEKRTPEIRELVNTFKPDLIWSDGAQAASDDYFMSKEFLAWLYNDSPIKDTVIVNDRWGNTTKCKHGGYWTCNDRYNPKVLQKKKFENCDSIQKSSWGYRRDVDLSDFQTIEELLARLAQTISCGGNYLLNVGPTHDGRILPIFEERLRQLGTWLKVNGEAVYYSKPWVYQNDTVSGNVWYTKAKSNSSSTGYSVYAFVLEWPDNNSLTLGSPILTPHTTVSMLGYTADKFYYKPLQKNGSGLVVHFPNIPPNKLPSYYAWVLKIDNLAN